VARVSQPRQRSARRQFAATMLVLEAFVVLFATLVAFGLRVAAPGQVWLVGGALALALVLAAGVLRRPGGYVVGSVLQVAVVLAGLAVTLMYVVGGVFAVLWVVSLRLGARIDRERAERDAAAAGR
jgi:Sec-independent protein secretion pathway component TatC